MHFIYQALDKNGSSVNGRIVADSDIEALRKLSAQGLSPLAVKTESTPGLPAGKRRRIKAADCIQLLQELATLLHAGVALGEALPSLAEAYRTTALEDAVAQMNQAVRGGHGLSKAITDSQLPLPRYATALIDAGETSGRMAEALDDAAKQMAYEALVRQEIRNALTYPAILVISGLLAVFIVIVGVVPRFAGLLKNSRADVPEISRLVINFGIFAKENILALGLLAFFVVLAGVFAANQASWRQKLLDVFARWPLTRDWILPAEIGRWATLLATLLANKVSMIDALRLSRDLLNLPSLQRYLDEALREVRRGKPLSDIFSSQGWLGPTQVNLIRVGERSGELPRMLRSLGHLQTEAARQRIKRLLTLLEPLAILTIGVVIGFIMVAVMMAITSLNTARY